MEKKEKPVAMNAFELISRSQSFNLENLFGKQMVSSMGKGDPFRCGLNILSQANEEKKVVNMKI